MKYFVLIIIFFALTSCNKYGPEQIKAWDLIDNGALLIDVRTDEEFKNSHLAKAINIEYENIAKIVQAIGNDKNRPVVLYCRSGRRASITQQELKKLGYSNIYNGQGLSQMQAALTEKMKNKSSN